MQWYAGIYLLQNHSTCFGCPSHQSSGVYKNVTAASGTGYSIWVTIFLQRGVATLEDGCCLTYKSRASPLPVALSALSRTPHVGGVEHSMTGARQTMAVTTFRKSNENWLERRVGDCRSSRKNAPLHRKLYKWRRSRKCDIIYFEARH